MTFIFKCRNCGVEIANGTNVDPMILCCKCEKKNYEAYKYPSRDYGGKYFPDDKKKDIVYINGKEGMYVFPSMKIYKLSYCGDPFYASGLCAKIRKDFDMKNNCWHWESSHGAHDGWHLYIESSSLEKLTEFKNIIRKKYNLKEEDLTIIDGDNQERWFTMHSIFIKDDRNELHMGGLPQWCSIKNMIREFGKPLKELKQGTRYYLDEDE